jgi:chromosomal replication initiator protein
MEELGNIKESLIGFQMLLSDFQSSLSETIIKVDIIIEEQAKIKYNKSIKKDDKKEEKKPTVEKLIAKICIVSKISKEELDSKKEYRKREYVVARQMHMAALHKVFKYSAASAGSTYGKDHATVLYAAKTIHNLYQTDSLFRETWKPIFKLCSRKDKVRTKRWLEDGE